METEKIYKVLANKVRLNILRWLKEPEKHFPPMEHLPKEEQGKGYICVTVIKEKSTVSQSTVSHFLTMMKNCGLLESKRIGQWTYYRRNEQFISDFTSYLKHNL